MRLLVDSLLMSVFVVGVGVLAFLCGWMFIELLKFVFKNGGVVPWIVATVITLFAAIAVGFYQKNKNEFPYNLD